MDVKWGIIGCGGIARKFVSSLKALPTGTLVAVASSSAERAETFAKETGLDPVATDYAGLLANPDVDAVYIATTHNFHAANLRQCLESGKHVLCEKPMTINAAQAEEMIALARAKNLFLMEGMWARFLPAIRKARELVNEGAIGEVITVKADLSFRAPQDADNRLRNRKLAGGALLDVGIYPISFASMVFGGTPAEIRSHAVMGDTGVDERSFYVLEYDQGRTAFLSSSISGSLPVEAVIGGTEGYIRVLRFLGAKEIEVCRNNQPVEKLSFPFPEEEGFKFEIEHVMECIAAGKTESPVMPLDETLAIQQTMETMRKQWGLTYPEDV
ncbi:Gfo/Idh/MocA family oxidoreductase [Pontiellaceae bacterium B12219]|nr:Gfo/Idh/MocA family oxidoreductase [Pontiellaceae bacterium B12219]